MKNGISPIKTDRRDFNHLKTFGITSFSTASLPEYFNVDAGFGFPNQTEANPVFNIPALYYGCTGYTQTELCQDEDQKRYNPRFTYDMTPPGTEDTGRDMRSSLKSTIDIGVKDEQGNIGNKRVAYFNVSAAGQIDSFDAVRIAIWINQSEKRSVSVASPWYPAWEPIGNGNGRMTNNGIIPAPSDYRWLPDIGGHNWKISGWKTINGILYLIGKSWQGTGYGDGGYHYISREIFNNVMKVPGTGAYTLDKPDGYPIKTNQNVIDILVAYIRKLFNV